MKADKRKSLTKVMVGNFSSNKMKEVSKQIVQNEDTVFICIISKEAKVDKFSNPSLRDCKTLPQNHHWYS